jgi:methyltransferase, putative, TIGR00027 family
MQGPINFTNSSGTHFKGRESSKLAEGIALHRALESQKPESERICYDPYAIYFINQETLEPFSDPQKVKVSHEYYERLLPGFTNSVRTRVRYFDDFVKKSIDEGLEQLVILGAGYDTRAYRIEGLKGKVKVYEVDHPNTQSVKIEKIKEIFGFLPEHVIYVPVDFETEDFGERLIEKGYDRSFKTLFLMEGLIMYITLETVDETLTFIAKNSGKGSSILLDYFPESVIDGSCELEVGKNMREYAAKQGEHFKFGIKEEEVETFLAKRGFSQIYNVTSEDYKKMYFQGINKDKSVCSLMLFVHAVVQ